MMLWRRFLLINVIATICQLWTSAVLGYNLPGLQVDIFADNFCVSVDDLADIRWILYSVSVPEKSCHHYQYVTTNGSDRAWSKARLNGALIDDDHIKVTAVIKHLNDVYTSCAEFLVRERRAVSLSEIIPIFEDAFNGTEINRNVWTREVKHLMYSGREEFVLFDDSDRTAYVDQGYLYIVPLLQEDNLRSGSLQLGHRCTADNEACTLTARIYVIRPPVHSALLHTRDHYTLDSGRVEIRARLPRGDWLFPYLHLRSVQNPNLQLRIAFARGNAQLLNARNEDIGGKRLFGGATVWLDNINPTCYLFNTTNNQHYGDDFHVYSLNLQPDSIELMVDGVSYGTITDDLHRSTDRFYIELGVSVGGHSEFVNSTKPWTDSAPKAALAFWEAREKWRNTWRNNETALIVDYVRVFES